MPTSPEPWRPERALDRRVAHHDKPDRMRQQPGSAQNVQSPDPAAVSALPMPWSQTGGLRRDTRTAPHDARRHFTP